MPKFDTKGLTIGKLKDIANGKAKPTPEEKKEIKGVPETLKKFSESFQLPDFSIFKSILKNPLDDIYNLPFSDVDYEAKAEERALNKLLLEDMKTKRQQKQLINPVFDFAKSEIHFAGKIIKISKGSNEYQVCRAVFSDPAKDWSWDEIVERWGENPEMKNWRVTYNAAKQVNKKVAIETGVKDLLKVSTKNTSINSSYLNK